MANRKTDYKLLHNPKSFADNLQDLRKGNDGKSRVTFEQLSKGIFDKTGVSISAQQLSKYENADLEERPNINNILAIAKYYGVSIDYLLGWSKSREAENKYKIGSKEFGLSDKAMKRLETIKRGDPEAMILSSKLVNFILENDHFWDCFDFRLTHYLDSKYNHKSLNIEDDMARYSVIRAFEELLDGICDLYLKNDLVIVL